MSTGARSEGLLWGGVAGPLDGPVQRLDPRVRILATLAFAGVVVAVQRLPVLTAALAAGFGLALLARLPWRRLATALLVMDGFLLLALATLPFTIPGEVVVQWGALAVSDAGLLRAAAIALKANAVLLMVMALLGTLDAVALGHALHHLRVPPRLIQLLLFTVRYLDLLHREYLRLRQALRARAFRPRADRHTWRSVGYFAGMLLVRSLERSERILAAMKCRGFDGRFHAFRHPPAGPWDGVFAASFVALLVALGAWEWAA